MSTTNQEPTKQSTALIPGLIASPLPFRLVKRSEKDTWSPTLEDINKTTYDYVRLHRISGTIDIGLPKPYTLAVTFDGSFILPAISNFKDISLAVNEFNQLFGSLLLGGIFIQAVDATYVQQCGVYKNYYFKTFGSALNAFVELKNSFRHKHASVKDTIILLDSDFVLLQDIQDSYLIGKKILAKVKNLSPEILIKGVSSYIVNSYSESLINNWLSIEQLIDFIWVTKVVASAPEKNIAGRQDFLKDNRTWPTSTKIEVFYQLQLVSAALYKLLSAARKARNNFIHTGKNPSKNDADSSLKSLLALLSLCVSDFHNYDLFDTLLRKYNDMDPIKKTFYDKKQSTFKVEEVDYWLDAPIPPIPGDERWEENHYPYDIGLNF